MPCDRPIIPDWWSTLHPVLYGSQKCSPGHSFGPAVRPYYLIHYILEGSGTYWRGGTEFTLGKGDIFIIYPEEVTVYTASQETPWSYVWLGFQALQAPLFLDTPVIRNAPVEDLFSQLAVPMEQSLPSGLVHTLTYNILWRLFQVPSQADAPSEIKQYASYAKAYMDTAFMKKIQIQQIADDLHIDRRYLTALFQQTYGISPKRYLLQVRLVQAEAFLQQGYQVAKAAEMSGFMDVSNFFRQYKSFYGHSPTQPKSLSDNVPEITIL